MSAVLILSFAVTDFFFSEMDRWKDELLNLPESFRELIATTGGALHDSVHAPKIAMTFGNLPEQLLDRTREIELADEDEVR